MLALVLTTTVLTGKERGFATSLNMALESVSLRSLACLHLA